MPQLKHINIVKRITRSKTPFSAKIAVRKHSNVLKLAARKTRSKKKKTAAKKTNAKAKAKTKAKKEKHKREPEGKMSSFREKFFRANRRIA